MRFAHLALFLADQCEGEWPGLMRASKKSTSDSTGLTDCGFLPTSRVCVDSGVKELFCIDNGGASIGQLLYQNVVCTSSKYKPRSVVSSSDASSSSNHATITPQASHNHDM